MYPSQTSLIPATASLLNFFYEKGFEAFSQNYPYWYLGSTPYKYLIGPILPFVLKPFSNINTFSVLIFILIASFIFSAIGWGILTKKISDDKKLGIIVFIILLFLPWRLFSSLSLGDVTFEIAKNLLPFVFILFWNTLERKNRKKKVYFVIGLILLLLLSTNVLFIYIVGVSLLATTKAYKKGKLIGISRYIREIVKLTLIAIFISSLWYGFGYWKTILFNPSIGGISLYRVIVKIFNITRAVIPIIMATIIVLSGKKVRERKEIFALSWIGVFAFLSLYRFLADIDFWQDWTAWMGEIEIGIAFIVSWKIRNISKSTKNIKYVLLLVLPFAITYKGYVELGKSAILSASPPRIINSLSKLKEISGNDLVFISGSTVFWANSGDSNIHQVRGGRDQVSLHKTWDRAAYELREGNVEELSKKWLEEFNISYVLIHTEGSSEYYHDFKNISKWNSLGEIVWEDNGDRIIKVIKREKKLK